MEPNQALLRHDVLCQAPFELPNGQQRVHPPIVACSCSGIKDQADAGRRVARVASLQVSTVRRSWAGAFIILNRLAHL